MKTCLIIFAKEPEENKVKTRLQRSLPGVSCTDLYKAFLKDILELGDKTACDKKVLAYEAYGRDPVYLKSIGKGLDLYQQRGSDLGERMTDAITFAGSQGASRIIVIGTDTPMLTADIIKETFSLLETNDIVLGPTEDGGFFLIGLHGPCPELFDGVVWSSSSVLSKTAENAMAAVKKVGFLPELYDVDEAENFFRLCNDLKTIRHADLAKWTRDFLENEMVEK